MTRAARKNPDRGAVRSPNRAAPHRAATGGLTAGFVAAVVVCLGAAGADRAFGQSISRAIEFEDLGFTAPLAAGARAAAMAGAYAAAGDDVHALVYNPAGLARIKRIEFSLGLQQDRSRVDDTFFGTERSVDTRSGGLDAVALAYPFPTYRGSLVAAFGVYRVFSSYLDIDHSGSNTVTMTDDNYLLQQTGSVYSYNVGIGVDLSPTLSGGVAFFVLDSSIDALRQYDFTFVQSSPLSRVFVKDDVAVDLDGYGGRLGLQFFVRRWLRGGVSFTTPTWISLTGSGTTEVTEHLDNAIDTFDRTTGVIDESYLLPFRLDGGIALQWRTVQLAVEAGYADWTEASVNRRRFRDGETLATIFREVTDYRVALEATLPWAPVRLRAGFARRPFPLAYLQGDRIENDRTLEATIDTERREMSVGAGALVGSLLSIDAAYQHLSGRRSISTLTDERVLQRVLLTASYRF